MGRTRWTDERLDDRFARLDRDIRELRGEVREGFGQVRGELDALRLLVHRLGGGFLLTLLVAVLLRGI